MEEADKKPQEALRAIGASRVSILFGATLPSIMPTLRRMSLASRERRTLDMWVEYVQIEKDEKELASSKIQARFRGRRGRVKAGIQHRENSRVSEVVLNLYSVCALV